MERGRRSIRREARRGRSCRRRVGYISGMSDIYPARQDVYASRQKSTLVRYRSPKMFWRRSRRKRTRCHDFERASYDCRRWRDSLTNADAADDSAAHRRAELRTASTSEIRSTRGVLSTAAGSRERATEPPAPQPLRRYLVFVSPTAPISFDAIRYAVGGDPSGAHVLRPSSRTAARRDRGAWGRGTVDTASAVAMT